MLTFFQYALTYILPIGILMLIYPKMKAFWAAREPDEKKANTKTMVSMVVVGTFVCLAVMILVAYAFLPFYK